ncbi:MAG: TonB-dependent receptor [Candidatus Thiodiazotropha sp. (ex. Lucinisca nassula)]|nr:TonB-dependent receptor [Candidatus Thiodiazotropha sp. (ex. Lucinisca nassula)]
MRKLALSIIALLSGIASADDELDSITVYGSQGDAQQSQNAESLRKGATNSTLGGYLDSLPNVDSASYGEAVGRPVIRGMSGYRVKILHNDNHLSDLSAMSQDHAVAVAPRASERIQLLKGPASLLYAAQAGGVIKISDALDAPFPEPGLKGELSGDIRSDAESYSLDSHISLAKEHWALQLGGLTQESDPYKSGDGETIADSDVNTDQGQFSLGWRPNSRNELQINGTSLEKDYGIPNATPEATRINMQRDDVGFKYRYLPNPLWLDEITLDLLSSDYLHDETEGGRKDGLFGQEQQRGTLNLAWATAEWWGESRISYVNSELKVCHEHGACDDFEDASRSGGPLGESIEQYVMNRGLPYSHGHPMPDTQSRIWQASTVAQRMFSDSYELISGIHWQSRQLQPDPDNIQEQWVYPTSLDPDYYDERNDHTLSLSLGVNKQAMDAAPSWEISLSYLERLPSVDELYWNGFHHATDSYIFGNSELDKERSLNLDIDLTFEQNSHRMQLSAFYYRFSDYIYQDRGYDESGAVLIDPFHISQVWFTRQTDADFVGGSLRYENRQALLRAEPDLTFWGQIDLLRATDSDGEDLPRTAPASAEIGVQFEQQAWLAKLSFKRVAKARNLAPQEEETAGYNWLSLYLEHDWQIADQELKLWLKGENLLDEFAQNHLSVLKDTAPLPGRQITAGIDWRF